MADKGKKKKYIPILKIYIYIYNNICNCNEKHTRKKNIEIGGKQDKDEILFAWG